MEICLINTTEVKNDYKAFHIFFLPFFKSTFARNQRIMNKVGFFFLNPRERYAEKVDGQINVDV